MTFFGCEIFIECVYCLGHLPDDHIPLQIFNKRLIVASPPFCMSSPGILFTPVDLPFFNRLTASTISSLGISASSSCSCLFCNHIGISLSHMGVKLYNTWQYSLHLSATTLPSTSGFPFLLCIINNLACRLSVNFLCIRYASFVLLLLHSCYCLNCPALFYYPCLLCLA